MRIMTIVMTIIYLSYLWYVYRFCIRMCTMEAHLAERIGNSHSNDYYDCWLEWNGIEISINTEFMRSQKEADVVIRIRRTVVLRVDELANGWLELITILSVCGCLLPEWMKKKTASKHIQLKRNAQIRLSVYASPTADKMIANRLTSYACYINIIVI